MKNKKGFSLIELIIVIAILTMLSTIAIMSFSGVGSSQALDKDTLLVISILNEAKSQAISSKDFSDFGVRILNDRLIFFKGVYGMNNIEYVLSRYVNISTSTGVGSDIIFSNVSGNSNASGTVSIFIINDPIKKNSINIFNTGAIEKR